MTYDAETRILRADESKWITNDDINFAIEAKLAPSESVKNWWEVDEIPPQPEEKTTETQNDYIANEYARTEPEE